MALDPVTITAITATVGSIIASIASSLIRYFKAVRKKENVTITIKTKSGENLELATPGLDEKELHDAIKMIIETEKVETDKKFDENASK